MNDRNKVTEIIMKLMASGGNCTIEMSDGSIVKGKSLLGASMSLNNLHRPDATGKMEIEAESGRVEIDLFQVKSVN